VPVRVGQEIQAVLRQCDSELKDSRAATRAADGSVRVTKVGEWASVRAQGRLLRGDVPYDRICVNLCVNNF
jgi:hypothetical protein